MTNNKIGSSSRLLLSTNQQRNYMTNKNIIVCDQQRNGIVHMTIDQQKNSITHKPTKNYINKQLSKIYNRPTKKWYCPHDQQ